MRLRQVNKHMKQPGEKYRFRTLLSPRLLLITLIVVILGGYWFLPIDGRILIVTNPQTNPVGAWPQTRVEPQAARPDEPVTLYISDNVPWANIKLMIDGEEIPLDEEFISRGPLNNGPWTWRWVFRAPDNTNYAAIFYHDCHTGCIERTRIQLGPTTTTNDPDPPLSPTELGVVFADPTRDWRGRAGWSVELTYTQRPFDENFSIDGLAQWVHKANEQGLRVLVRIAYDYRQAMPPTSDEVALARYLDACERLARDERFKGVYGYIIGSGINGLDENELTPEQPTTPEWYARVFNGYSVDPQRTDNVVQRMRAVNPQVRLLVVPLTPWIDDQDGAIRDFLNQPWLNYMNTLVAHIDESVKAKREVGTALANPDGFAIQAPGRPTAPEVANQPSREPATDLYRTEWGRAQAGFRVYKDWLRIINRYDTTRGMPAYIVSTNTWTSDERIPPAQNYPPGWLTNALREVRREPQLQALCWFLDHPQGDPSSELWGGFSLNLRNGQMFEAAREFDELLQN
ncbi:MAG: hypothetical protein GFH27_549311n20 [Chloroflexi bacterium AL-W]|nr:hypothetical protein [Chloroflexi bacterium AL-N1]NOK68802.1 hypothetical protein [Chloroflexi bacterium AL-N10]NOK76288.1 hypothetical protein [Chloroflexi bacterium AL-N5]NOK84075.1 hypothetical protein [Chloroflexi bacterium AL-W]NOK91426.1 hypothetical protein [Chloroflexi bacterium AL-N15]